MFNGMKFGVLALIVPALAACMSEGGQTMAPLRGQVVVVESPEQAGMAPASAAHFCRRYPDQPMCQMAWATFKQPVRDLVKDYWQRFDHQDDAAGDTWRYMSADHGGKMRGDCEDFALTIMNALLGVGVPRTSLAMAIVATKRPRYRDHAVLLINTDQGVFVAHSESSEVLPIGHYYGWTSWARQPWGGSIAELWVPFELQRAGTRQVAANKPSATPLDRPGRAQGAMKAYKVSAKKLWGPTPTPRPVRLRKANPKQVVALKQTD
ncbi:MAG: transglutaminase-like cysteine peptidase [Alphaproteobacteria bacterium]